MILKKIKLINFMSFKQLELDFPVGLYLFDGYNYDNDSANGAGKTAIFNAITYALYGKTPRNCKLDDFAHWNSNGHVYCQLDLEHSNNIYSIVRQRSPDKLQLYINNNIYEQYVDINELNNKISSIIGVSYNCFVNSIYYAQNRDDNFLIKNDDSKKKILTEIVGISEFDNIVQEIKKDNNSVLESINNLNYDKKHTEQLIVSLNKDIEDYDKLCLNKKDDKESKEKYLNNKIQFINDRIAKNIESIEKYKIEFNKKDEYERLLLKIQSKKAKVDSINEKKIEISTARKHTSSKILEKSEELQKYEDFLRKGICFTCGQTIYEVDRMKKQAQDLADVISDLKTKEKKMSLETTQLEELYKQHKDKVDSKYSECLLKYNESVSSNDFITKLTLENEMFKKDIDQYKLDLGNLDNSIDDVSLFKEKKEKELGDSNKKILKINKDLDFKIQENKILQHLINIFGKDGIKAVVFNQIVEELNKGVNKYVQKLFEIPIYLNFDIVGSIKNGNKIVDKIETKLTIQNREIDFNLLSGGEQKRLILAVDFALSEVMSKRSGNQFNFLILDEVFDGLDSHSKLKFMQFLQELKQDKSQIFVIDHSCDFKNSFDHVINIEKRGGESIII